MVLRTLEEHVISRLDAYDLLNNVDVGNYDQVYYIEKEGLPINFILEVEDEEDSSGEDAEDDLPQEQMKVNPLGYSNPSGHLMI